MFQFQLSSSLLVSLPLQDQSQQASLFFDRQLVASSLPKEKKYSRYLLTITKFIL